MVTTNALNEEKDKITHASPDPLDLGSVGLANIWESWPSGTCVV